MKFYMPTLFILLFFIYTASFGQVMSENTDVVWGSVIKENPKYFLNNVAGYDKTGLYVVKNHIRNGKKVILEHYNHELKLINSKEIEESDTYIHHITELNGKLYMSTVELDRANRTQTLYLQSIDPQTLTPGKDIKKILSSPYKANKNSNYDLQTAFKISRDSSKVLIYNKLPEDSQKQIQFALRVFDNNMELLWEKDVSLPYEDKLFDISKVKINNAGDVYFLGRIFKEKRKNERRGEVNFHYQILRYSNMGNTYEEYPVKIENKYITDMQIELMENNDLICAGFYSDKGTYSINGSYFLTIDHKSKNIINESYKEFDIDFITQNMKPGKAMRMEKREAKGKNVELYEYDLRDLVLKEDGGAVLIGEQFYVTQYTSQVPTGNGMFTTVVYTYYNYNDIIVININADGKIEWAQKIAKSQVSSRDSFLLSYALAVVGSNLYFIYNDNPKNIFVKSPEKIKTYGDSKNATVMVVELSPDGNQSRKVLFGADVTGVSTLPRFCEQISENEMILFGKRGKKQRLAKVIWNSL